MHICRKFLGNDFLQVMSFIKFNFVFNAYLAIHCVYHRQLMVSISYMNLLTFSFLVSYICPPPPPCCHLFYLIIHDKMVKRKRFLPEVKYYSDIQGKVLFRHSRFMVEVFLMANRDFF